MKGENHVAVKRVILTFALSLLSASCILFSQNIEYQWYYRVYFNDKGDYSPENFLPKDLLSNRAVLRREKSGVAVPDMRDIPVYKNYLDQLSGMGYKLHCTSKWMNTALYKSQYKNDLNAISDLPFVEDVKLVKTPVAKGINFNKLKVEAQEVNLHQYDRPITMLNAYSMYNAGFNGKSKIIAILDGGFTNVDNIESIYDLRKRKAIIKTYDFIERNEFVYGFSTHGTAVLSVLAGRMPEYIFGTAPGADYLLLRTEDGESEFPCEEDFWIAAAEYADSLGADIISTSLGYYSFDNPDMNYNTSELDGNSSFITRAADIASSKGILVVTSAGNERNQPWGKITFPADGDSVLAIGAVDGSNIIASFSSPGLTTDNRIKPDIVAMGVNVPVQISTNSILRSNGTSFSCPIISGMAAVLMQAVPQASNTDIIEALRASSDRYTNPDSLYGYGIPDMSLTLNMLKDKLVTPPSSESVASPNPTFGDIQIIFQKPPGNINIEIISIEGRVILRKHLQLPTGSTINISDLSDQPQGIYFIRIIKASGVIVHKIVKLNI